MKKEAIYHLENILKDFNYSFSELILSKTKQANKKPIFIAKFELDKCPFYGFILQNDDNEWVFNLNSSQHSITKEELDSKVKESEFLTRKRNRYLAKQEKINLSPEQEKEKTIQIKEARKFKSIK